MSKQIERCVVCQGKMAPLFTARILKKYDVGYFICNECLLIQSEPPYWLNEAYDRALSVCDTGIMERNFHNTLRATAVILMLAGRDAKVVDVAGGYGILTRLLRDVGFNCVWSDKYCDNLISPGFEAPVGFLTDVACAFEVLEHVSDPYVFLREIVEKYECRSILFSTDSFIRVPEKSWVYFSFDTGQHITLYSRKSLVRLAGRLGWHYYALPRQLHLLCQQKLVWWKTVVLKTPLLYLAGLVGIVFLRGRSKTRQDNALYHQ